MSLPIITLLTDFGELDPYVGTLKGVIASLVPEAKLVDLTHAISPGDVRRAAFACYEAAPYFPPETVHLAVVDPGVGSLRRPMALATDHGYFVGPDNGIFTYIYHLFNVHAIVELAEPGYWLPKPSHTFHGRDIFSPAAAHLAAGVPIDKLGPAVDDPVKFTLPRLEDGAQGEITAEVLHADRFGNLVTSVGVMDWAGSDDLGLSPWLPGRVAARRFPAALAQVTLSRQSRTLYGISHTFSDVPEGELAAIVGSHGQLEIAVHRGNAAEALGVRAGDEVILKLRER